jgi:mannosyltransferase
MRLKQYTNIRHALVVLILAAFALRLFHIQTQSLWRDEIDAIFFATGDWSSLLSMFTRPGENGPLYFLLLRPWLTLLGDGEFVARYSSLIFGVLAVPLTYQLGRRLLPIKASYWGAILIATSPYLIWYSQETKMYALLVSLSVLSSWFLLGALQDNRSMHWIGYVITTSLGFYTHILAVTLLPFHVVLFVVGGRRFWTRWRGALISLACLTLPYVPLARWEIPTLLSNFETGHPFYSLDTVLHTLFKVQSFGLREPSIIEVSLVVFLLLMGTFLYRRQEGAKSTLESYPQAVLWLYVLVPILTVFLISLGMPIFTDRYLITIAPAFYLLLACGLEALRMRSHLLFSICLIGMMTTNCQALWAQSHTTIKADFRSAAAYYRDHATPDDLVVIQMPYVHRNFEYYYPQPYHRADGLYTNGDVTPEQVADQMTDLTEGYATIWLLKSEAEMWDTRGLVEDWLRTQKQLTDGSDFQRLSLYRYVNAQSSDDK